MKNIEKRFLLFLLGCIPTRLFITYIISISKKSSLPYIGLLTLNLSYNFIYLYLYGNNTADSQLEWAGLSYILWNNLRLVHGILIFIFSILALNKNKNGYYILLLDTFIGLLSFLYYHFYQYANCIE